MKPTILLSALCSILAIGNAQVKPPDFTPQVTELQKAAADLTKAVDEVVNNLSDQSKDAIGNFVSQYLKMTAESVQALDRNTQSLVKVVTQLKLGDYNKEVIGQLE